MKWTRILIVCMAVAVLAQAQEAISRDSILMTVTSSQKFGISYSDKETMISKTSPSSFYDYPIVLITNTNDFQWSRIDTVKEVYYESDHTTTIEMNGKPHRWYHPFVVREVEN